MKLRSKFSLKISYKCDFTLVKKHCWKIIKFYLSCQNLIVFAVIMRGNAVYSPYKNNYTTYYLKLAQLRSLQDLTKIFKTKKMSDLKKIYLYFQQHKSVICWYCVVEDDPSPRKRTCEVSTSSDLRVGVIIPGLLCRWWKSFLSWAVCNFFYGFVEISRRKKTIFLPQ